MRIDLNSDIGESYGLFQVGQDEHVLMHVTSVNIACGFHAGDYQVMAKTVRLASKKGVAIGAHPGYPDLQGFGRRYIEMSAEEIYHSLLYQIGALQAICAAYDTQVVHVKPHGALYNIAAVNSEIADAVARAVHSADPKLILFGLSGSELVRAGNRLHLKVAHEVFADRTYQPNGTLTPRSEPNAIITDVDLVLQRVFDMVCYGETEATNGQTIPLKADTICVHGDEPKALLFVQKLRQFLQQKKVELKAVGTV